MERAIEIVFLVAVWYVVSMEVREIRAYIKQEKKWKRMRRVS
jgi:hypothetical protein